MLKNKRKNHAVSEVFGTILLLIISVSLLSTVYVALFSINVEKSSPDVSIVGTMEGNKLILEHRGGEELSIDTKIILGLTNGSTKTISVNDYLSDEYKIDGKWNIGERFIYPLSNLVNYLRFDPINITVVDLNSNSVIMKGVAQEARVADTELEMSVSNDKPNVGEDVTFNIKANNNGPSETKGIFIRDILPGSLIYKNNITSKGKYDSKTNIWNLSNLTVGGNTTLNITATVNSYGYISQFTQLALVLDGSGSISDYAWGIMKNGLKNAIQDPNVFPHDGSVELTVVQFGVGSGGYCARIEVPPVVVYNDNYMSIANQIADITQGKGWTPMAAGIYLAADTLKSSNNFGGFNTNHRQIICLVTDGNPNVISGPCELCGDNFDGYPQGQAAAEDAKYYLLNTLSLTDDQDEFDVVAVQGSQIINITWLKDNIAWPQPGWTNWPPTSSGWVHEVHSWQEFVDSLREQFNILFRRIDNTVDLLSSTYMDPNPKNNKVTVSIYPTT
jgi:uncharacterized repeat protein (TIGR01451 family)